MDLLLDATHRIEARHFWFRGLRRFLRPLLEQATGRRTAPRILDCGSGTGVNLPVLARCGTAWGIDLSMYGIELARAAGGSSARISGFCGGSSAPLRASSSSFPDIASLKLRMPWPRPLANSGSFLAPNMIRISAKASTAPARRLATASI